MFAELRGTGARQSGGVHDVDGRGEADIPALFAGAAHSGHVAHQLRGARRLHEPTSATGTQGADESQSHRHPASLCRGTAPWRESHTILFLLLYPYHTSEMIKSEPPAQTLLAFRFRRIALFSTDKMCKEKLVKRLGELSVALRRDRLGACLSSLQVLIPLEK